MEAKYIFAIVVLGIFFLLIFVSFAVLEHGRIKEEKLQAWINERYANNESAKPDYDSVTTEEENIPMQNVRAVTDDVKDDVEESVVEESAPDEAYGKIDVEGIEEITGNYNGDD